MNVREARATTMAKISSEGELTIELLLMAFCDAVVRLSHDLLISNDASKLSALLFRQPLSGTLQGSSLLDIVHTEDRHKLAEHLSSTRSDHPALSTSIRLLDAQGSAVKVHMYHTSCTDFEDKPLYLVGICEHGPAWAGPAWEVAVAPQTTGSVEVEVGRNICVDNASRTTDGQDSSGTIELIPLQPAVEGEDVSLWFDAFSDNYEISTCNAEFSALFGPCHVGCGLLKYIHNPTPFQSSVQLMVNGLFSGSLEESSKRLGKLALRRPSEARSGPIHSGEATIDIEAMRLKVGEETEMVDHENHKTCLLKLILHSVVTRSSRHAASSAGSAKRVTRFMIGRGGRWKGKG